MDHSWRPPPLPPIPGNNTNICPICSISHFPFCPPPPFIENPRFHYSQPQNDYYHHRHPFDHHHPLPNHHTSLNSNYYFNPSDGRRPTWYGSDPTLNMSPYDAIGDPHIGTGNHNNHPIGGFAYDNGGIKRMKIEPIDNNRAPRGPLMGGEIGDTSRFPSHNERILKLIHDHGNAAIATPGGPQKLGSESNGDIGLKRRRAMIEISSVGMGSFERKEPHPSDYSRHSSQPAADAIQPNHFLLSRVPTDVGRPVDVDNHTSQPPYYWSESKSHYTPNSFGTNLGLLEVHHGYGTQPSLPASLPPPLPVDIPRNHFFKPLASAPPKKISLFPVGVSSSADSSSGSAVLENQSSAPVYYTNNASHHASSLSSAEEFHIRHSSSEKHARDIQPFPLRHLSSENQNIVDASHIFKQPHRASRPDHFVIILRGLPGSGKSYLAKMMRDIEVEHGGEAPRIHSMDEYFMIEVEKDEDSELSKSSGSLKGKRQVMKTVMEYCYEPEMEEAYRASMLKAFRKTLDEGVYSFIIVDDRNLRVADFAQFWATAKRSGYEVYMVEASYKDPAGCAARNVHNFTLPDIQKMAGQWEEAPTLYLRMDIKSLLHGDGFDEGGIQEVDMDMEDDDAIDASQGSDVKSPHDETKDQVDDSRPHDELNDAAVTNHKTEEVKDLSRSKWSNDFDVEEGGGMKKNSSGALSGLVQAYSSKEAKSVCWGDQGGNVGFSIGTTRKANTRSLVIGPGPGYNLKSNPLSEEEYLNPAQNPVEPKTQNVFQERIRAERESFKAVFDRRRQRIGGFNMDEE